MGRAEGAECPLFPAEVKVDVGGHGHRRVVSEGEEELAPPLPAPASSTVLNVNQFMQFELIQLNATFAVTWNIYNKAINDMFTSILTPQGVPHRRKTKTKLKTY